MVDRCAVILRPKKPFVAWARSLPGPFTIPSQPDDYSVYLLPAFERCEHLEGLLGEYAPALFEIALEAWWEDPKAWPPTRDLEALREWFHVDAHSMVIDMSAYDDARQQL